MQSHRLPTYFISHGGAPTRGAGNLGPLGRARLRNFLRRAARNGLRLFRLSRLPLRQSAMPPRDRRDSPAAFRICCMRKASRPTSTRGFDHGTFSIMKPLYPEERMPVVQLSLDARLDPALHLEVGRALDRLGRGSGSPHSPPARGSSAAADGRRRRGLGRAGRNHLPSDRFLWRADRVELPLRSPPAECIDPGDMQ